MHRKHALRELLPGEEVLEERRLAGRGDGAEREPEQPARGRGGEVGRLAPRRAERLVVHAQWAHGHDVLHELARDPALRLARVSARVGTRKREPDQGDREEDARS